MGVIWTKPLRRWHAMLNLPRYNSSWYRDRLAEERRELRKARTLVEKISEESDVFFTIIRAEYDGFPIEKLPPFAYRQLSVYAYMLGKYTSRWTFYRTTAYLCNAPRYHLVREVVNPSKDHKLREVATRHQIDAAKFLRVGRRLRRFWPLLP
ncbi:hypothetical protein HYFRA_00006863 [Hymenoscyphus fraxineus]|uniref:Uncharacterized protein n=1 Tax=Hymenoscyphus fraxineus TaxID=746836 RepID=A0A9N9KQP2_9HELO|nr:hypothetical protein HYFRA_00006863 [Hymenoscyphus fraxineus]